jgi:hypothetical protein
VDGIYSMRCWKSIVKKHVDWMWKEKMSWRNTRKPFWKTFFTCFLMFFVLKCKLFIIFEYFAILTHFKWLKSKNSHIYCFRVLKIIKKKQDIYYFRIPKRQEKSTFFKSKMLKTREIKKHTLYFTFLKHQKSDRLLNNHISSSFHCLKNIRIQ